MLTPYLAVQQVVKRKLDTPLVLPVYGSMREAVAAGNSAGEVMLRGGEAMALFLGSLPDDKLPKDATQGVYVMQHNVCHGMFVCSTTL